MPLLPINLPPGLERNGSPYDTPGRFWDMNLMRWQSGSARPLGGWIRKTVAPLDGPIRRFHAWRNNDGTLGTMAASEAKLYIDYGGGWVDITPAGIVPPIIINAPGYGAGPYGMGTYGTPRPTGSGGNIFAPKFSLWCFSNWGEDVLLLSSEDRRIYHYVSSTPGTLPIVIPNSAVGGAPPMPLANAIGVTEERHVMIVGPTIAGVYYPHRVAWSSRETLDDWNFANLANSAGFLDVTSNSPLNYIVKVKEGMLIFSSTEVFLANYVGLPYVYGIQKLADMPIFHPYSVALFDNGKAFWPSNRGIQVYAGGAVQTIDCPIFNDIRIDFSITWGMARSHSSANGNYPEIWMFWPSLNAGVDGQPTECDRLAIFNFQEGWWGWAYLKRSAMISSGALPRPYCGTADANIYEHENGWTDAGLPLLDQRWLETGALGIASGDQVMDIKQAILATDGRKQSVKLQFFGRYTPDGDERIFGPYVPRLDGYTDTRVNAREARIRYVGNIDGLFEVGKLRLDVSTSGQR